jgi:hypothetical protein
MVNVFLTEEALEVAAAGRKVKWCRHGSRASHIGNK